MIPTPPQHWEDGMPPSTTESWLKERKRLQVVIDELLETHHAEQYLLKCAKKECAEYDRACHACRNYWPFDATHKAYGDKLSTAILRAQRRCDTAEEALAEMRRTLHDHDELYCIEQRRIKALCRVEQEREAPALTFKVYSWGIFGAFIRFCRRAALDDPNDSGELRC
jgi:hypothetical protein